MQVGRDRERQRQRMTNARKTTTNKKRHKDKETLFQNKLVAGHERDGHNFFEVADEDEFGGFLVVSPEGMADVGEREQK